MRLPNLNGLRAFDAAARRLNFRRAAEDLNVTQGAVAQQVRRLEAELGVALFERRARGVALTPAGRAYAGPVREAFASVEAATRALRPDPARVTLSAPPSLAAKWLTPRLGAFFDAHPEIDLRTEASESVASVGSDGGGADLALRQGPPPRGDGVEATPLAPLDLTAVAAPGFLPPSVEPPPSPAAGLAVFAGSAVIEDGHLRWRRLFADAGIASTGRVIRFNQTALAIDAATAGQGVALAPRLVALDDLAAGRLVALWRAPATEEGFHLVRAASRAGERPLSAVADWITAEAARV